MPDSAALHSLSSAITIEAWIKVEQFTKEWQAIVTNGDSSWRLHRHAGTPCISFSTTGLSDIDLASNRGVEDGQWLHVVAVYDGSRKYIYIYGVLDACTNATGLISQNNYPVCIGNNAERGGYYGRIFNGVIDEVSIYNRALTAAEIQAIYAAGAVGKCTEPPSMGEQPASVRVNVGGTATFSVVVAGNPILHYQWLFNGLEIPGAAEPSLTIQNVQETDGGCYCVRVTNWFGITVSSNAVLTVNHLPVADASASRLLYVSCTGTNASAVLDGTRSADPDGDPLQYEWSDQATGALLATGEVAVATLPVGVNTVALVVSDGLASDTNLITVEVLAPAQAVERLAATVRANVERPMPLLATLRVARAAIQRGNPTVAINLLRAFEHQVRAQVAPRNHALAEQLTNSAGEIIDALICPRGEHPHPRLDKIIRRHDGKVQLRITAPGWPTLRC